MLPTVPQPITVLRGFPVVRKAALHSCRTIGNDTTIVLIKRGATFVPVVGHGVEPHLAAELTDFLLPLCGNPQALSLESTATPCGTGFLSVLPLNSPDGEIIGALALLNAGPLKLTRDRKRLLNSLQDLFSELALFRAAAYGAFETDIVPRPETCAQYHPDGTVHWTGVAMDFAAQRVAAEALAESEERLRLTVEKSLDAIVSMDQRGIITSWNPQAETIFGWPAQECIGRHFVDLTLAPGTDEAEHEVFFRSLTHPEALDRRVVIRAFRRDGKAFPLEFAWTTLGCGESVSYISFLRDISEQVRTQNELHSLVQQAEDSNRGKTEFLSHMSHELRTPLNSVIGFAQLMLLNELDEESRESVQHILDAGNHLLDLINEVLDLRSIEAGQLNIELEEVDVCTAIRGAFTLVQPIAVKRGVRLMRPAEDTAGWVRADAKRLKQILVNLLSNAAKYTAEHGMVAVNVVRSGETIHIHVEDDGPGIPPDKFDRLFIPFDRLGAERSQIEGTGLGLPLTKKLVEAMGGEISVVSEPGQGSIFTISLLATDQTEAAA